VARWARLGGRGELGIVRSLGLRKIGALLVLACAGAQPAAGSSLAMRTLMLGLHGREHGHRVAVVAESGHLDLVLSHAGAAPHEHGGASHPAAHHPGDPDADHVFHLTDADDANARRASSESVASLAPALTMPYLASTGGTLQLAPQPRARGLEQLRTVVLRL
jgi:hypothetical protein